MANIIPISTVTVGSGGISSIQFNGIPQTYTDLLIKFSARVVGTGGDSNPWTATGIQLNATNPSSQRQLYGTGSGVGSDTNTSPIFTTDSNATSSTFSSGEVYIPNYIGTTQKSISVDVVTENNATASVTIFWSGLFNVTSPVTSVSLTGSGYTFDQYTTATLYGIRKY